MWAEARHGNERRSPKERTSKGGGVPRGAHAGWHAQAALYAAARVRPATPRFCLPALAHINQDSEASRPDLPGAHTTSATPDYPPQEVTGPLFSGAQPVWSCLYPQRHTANMGRSCFCTECIPRLWTTEEGAELNTTPLHVEE